MKLKNRFDHLRRKYFGRYEIEDPRPIAAGAPYTYDLPSENELLALEPGDLVRASFRSVPASPEWGAERMWVELQSIEENRLLGKLANIPSDMPQLRFGDRVTLLRSDVIDIDWSSDRRKPPPPSPDRRWYWERCLVDTCVIEDRIPVHFLYREEPDMAEEGDKYPDSGWRIRGDYRGLSDEQIDARKMSYIALGPVLNVDDSWLHLIDAPIGAAFIRDWGTGKFVEDVSGQAH